MASVNDATGIEKRAAGQWRLLEEANIDADDREAIRRFVKHRKIHGTERTGSYSLGTEESDLMKLRQSAERADVPLLEMGIDDVNRLIETLTAPKPPKDDHGRTFKSKDYDGIPPGEQGYGWGITTGIDPFTRSLRVFFRWADRHGDYGDYGFWEQIKTGNVDFPEPSERRFPTREEIDAMREAARGDPRAQAILDYYAESAVRRTLGAQLRIADLGLDGGGSIGYDGPAPAAFRPNPNGKAQKGVEVKPYPLFNGVSTLRVWVRNHHPDPDNEDAPVFTVNRRLYFKCRDLSYCHSCATDLASEPETCPECGGDVYDDGALSSERIAEILADLGEKAGLEDDVEIKPHAFRHAAVGSWKERGYSLGQVQRRTAWADKAAAEMWGRYGDPDDEKMDAGIAEKEGREPASEEDEADETPATPETYTCGNCGADEIETDHCGLCGAPVSPEARQDAMEQAEEQDATADLLNAALTEGDEDAIQTLADTIAPYMSEERIRDISEANRAGIPDNLEPREPDD